MMVEIENKSDPVKSKNQVSYCLLNTQTTGWSAYFLENWCEEKPWKLKSDILIDSIPLYKRCLIELNVCFCNMFLLAKLWMSEMKP